MKSKIEIKKISKINLQKYFELDKSLDPYKLTFYSQEHINMLLKNPSLEDEDIVSLFAFSNNIIVGRLDFLPKEIEANPHFEKIVWLSNLTVPSKFRNRFVGVILINEAKLLFPFVGSY